MIRVSLHYITAALQRLNFPRQQRRPPALFPRCLWLHYFHLGDFNSVRIRKTFLSTVDNVVELQGAHHAIRKGNALNPCKRRVADEVTPCVWFTALRALLCWYTLVRTQPTAAYINQEMYLIPLLVKVVLKMKGTGSVLLLFHYEFILSTEFTALHRPVREFALF